MSAERDPILNPPHVGLLSEAAKGIAAPTPPFHRQGRVDTEAKVVKARVEARQTLAGLSNYALAIVLNNLRANPARFDGYDRDAVLFEAEHRLLNAHRRPS